MTKHIIKHILLGAVALAAFSGAVMLLWNWLMPIVCGLTAITFWQALGLLLLARLLFGGLGGRFHRMGHHGGNPFREKWMGMSPEERMEFVRRRHPMSGHRGGKPCGNPGRDE